jgi:putative tricarboxylic transport membrane protein
MLDAFLAGLTQVFTLHTFGLMLIGIAAGFVVGILPGIGGLATLALMLPFTFDMKPVEAFAFLLGMLATTGTTGDITSILFGVPGEATSTATILDGHPMAKRGQAGRALGASLGASLLGGLLGAAVLVISIPIVQPLVGSMGSPEFLAVSLVGVLLVGALSGRDQIKGILIAGLGLVLAMVGVDPISGMERYTLESLDLQEGIGLVPVALGLFAIPEIVELGTTGTIAREKYGRLGGVMQGVRDSVKHWALAARCGMIGAVIGIIPGLGGGVSQWLAYGHSVQSSGNSESFGKGDVRGVIGPCAANNSGIGGSLIPTIAFGIPGSVVMAVLLGAFLIHGIVPGPKMLTENLALTFSFVWVIILSNVIAVAVAFLFINHLARLTTVRSTLLVPAILVLVLISAYTSRNSMFDVGLMLAFGLLGLVMVYLDWPRAPFLLGLVLGPLIEKYLFISYSRYGVELLVRPGVLLVLTGAAVYFLVPPIRRRLARQA